MKFIQIGEMIFKTDKIHHIQLDGSSLHVFTDDGNFPVGFNSEQAAKDALGLARKELNP